MNTLPCWYTIRIIFFFLVRMIFSYSLMMKTASSDFSTLFVILSKCSDSTFIDQWAEQLLFSFIFIKPSLLGSATSFKKKKKQSVDCELDTIIKLVKIFLADKHTFFCLVLLYTINILFTQHTKKVYFEKRSF